MRLLILFSIAMVLGVGLFAACNSNEAPKLQPADLFMGSDGVQRITAEGLHGLWAKGDVLVVDTRDENSYKSNHIKGAISIPSNQVLARINEFPHDKMIVTYCT
jgi:predicted sulfurtransferase